MANGYQTFTFFIIVKISGSMKSNYIKPQISTYEIELEQVVLTGSNEDLYLYIPGLDDYFESPNDEE